jgi:hypothetical protein
MEKHLERALIETFYAIAEFQQLQASSRWRADESETLAMDSVLRATRSMLESVLTRARQIQNVNALQASA